MIIGLLVGFILGYWVGTIITYRYSKGGDNQSNNTSSRVRL